MNRTSWTGLLALVLVVVAALELRPAPAPPPHRLAAVGALPAGEAAELARLRAHFDEVERELRERDVTALSASQRAERAAQIQALREYRDRGLFPHNHDFPEQRLPYFVDHRGVPCAMAYLIARSGGEALVEAVRSTRNHATIHELADDPALVRWLDGAGISLEEAARIQPMYDWLPPEPETNGVSARYSVTSAVVSGLGGASIALNVTGGREATTRQWPGVLGVAAGAFGIALGASKLGEGGDAALLGGVNAGIGFASLGLGARRLLISPTDRPAPETAADGVRRRTTLYVAPVLSPLDEGRAGVAVEVRF